ncbi:MAG: helicase [Kofleriaceae bacterium]|nr:MAG: helicase [Kofleriaceae bacterium]MBZ0231766.1 DEAD/DEAH box helicase family protein [Kofleriaceae bacterium]
MQDGVPLADVERQEDTVLAAIERLASQPGLVLADEVGMGKTFEALGVIAAFRHQKPEARICIVTPGPDLNRKWINDFRNFSDRDCCMYPFGDVTAPASRLGDLVDESRRMPVVVVPVSAFQGARGGADQQYLLSLFARWKGLHGQTANAIFRRFRDGRLDRIDPARELFLERFELVEIEPYLVDAFTSPDPETPGLGDLWDIAGGVAAFDFDEPIRRALDQARFRLVRALLPPFDLLIIDEAHKLKNADSLRNRGVSSVFAQKFAKALFLTATPFQLDISELRQVFSLFALASTAPAGMAATTEQLFVDIAEYQRAYDRLERVWRTLDAAQATLFARSYERDPSLAQELDDPTLRGVAEAVRAVRDLKRTRIEPGFQRWMVRSLHQEKRVYRQHRRQAVAPRGEAILPFLVYERFIAELFRVGEPTHKAAVEINMVSSFDAAARGDLFSAERSFRARSAEAYRRLLRDVLVGAGAVGLKDHPKLDAVAHDALDAAERGEKTLIFCARVDTIARLKRDLDEAWDARLFAAWQRVYPGSTWEEIFGVSEGDGRARERGRHGLLRDRFNRRQDLLHMALRERYLQTLVPAASVVVGHEQEIADRATALLHTLEVGHTSAERIDYYLAKRCVERAAVERWREGRDLRDDHRRLVDSIATDRFLRFGLDLTPDKLEGDDHDGAHTPTWTISAEMVDSLVPHRPHLWDTLASDLRRLTVGGVLDVDLRVHTVERLARYLTRREVLFLPELLLEAKAAGVDVVDIRSHELIEFVDGFWALPAGRVWVERLREFLRYFIRRPRPQRVDILEGPIESGEFVRHTVDAENREGLREAFNTPLHPMILVANEVMQEGLDLHHNCRRIVHHDLAWNPAQLEQRVGRIDRLGSLVRRMRETDGNASLDIHYPLIERTIDERMYRTVKAREKWLEFLLGARPDFNEHELAAERVPDLPPGLAESLVVDLRPPRAPDGRA